MPDAPKTASQDWTWVGTEDPAQFIFALFVKTELIRPGPSGNMPHREIEATTATPYTPPTQYKDVAACFKLDSLSSLGINDWYFIGCSINAETSTFYFFENKTDAQVNTPWDEKPTMGNHPWPMVILDVWVEQDNNFHQSANVVENNDHGIITAPTLRIHDAIYPPVSEGTRIITRKFLSATKPKIPFHKVPQTGHMRVQVTGDSREYEGLHDEIVVRATRSGTKKYMVTARTSSPVGGSVGEQVFVATNFITRRPYFFSDDPIRNAYGLWERTQVFVIPPKLPLEPTIRK